MFVTRVPVVWVTPAAAPLPNGVTAWWKRTIERRAWDLTYPTFTASIIPPRGFDPLQMEAAFIRGDPSHTSISIQSMQHPLGRALLSDYVETWPGGLPQIHYRQMVIEIQTPARYKGYVIRLRGLDSGASGPALTAAFDQMFARVRLIDKSTHNPTMP